MKRLTPEGNSPQGEPPRTASESPSETETPGSSSKRSKPGISPEALEKIGKAAPGVIRAVAVLIDAIAKLK